MLLGGCALPSVREAAHPHSPHPHHILRWGPASAHPSVPAVLEAVAECWGNSTGSANGELLALLYPIVHTPAFPDGRERSPGGGTSMVDVGGEELLLLVCQSDVRPLCQC